MSTAFALLSLNLPMLQALMGSGCFEATESQEQSEHFYRITLESTSQPAFGFGNYRSEITLYAGALSIQTFSEFHPMKADRMQVHSWVAFPNEDRHVIIRELKQVLFKLAPPPSSITLDWTLRAFLHADNPWQVTTTMLGTFPAKVVENPKRASANVMAYDLIGETNEVVGTYTPQGQNLDDFADQITHIGVLPK